MWVEPEQGLSGGVSEFQRFLDLYKAELSEFPVAVRLDINWSEKNKFGSRWQVDIPPFIAALSQRGIGYSIIFNAGRINGEIPTTDDGWVKSAEANVIAWRSTIHIKPSQVVIQTWNLNPVNILPESDGTTMTGYLRWYIETVGR